jgi:predicted DsbA family dithiol-disulfide isomerase
MSATPVPLSIDVVSDVICPWCYLGKRRLEKAIALVPEVSAKIAWRPFQLDPTTPPEGVDRRTYFERKFGSLAAVEPTHARLTAMGRELGIDYRFEDVVRTPNSLDAHRVIHWASAAGLADAAVERLFLAHFTEGVFLGDHAELARLAGEIGLDAATIAAWLATDRDRDAVVADIDAAIQVGVTGVPCFVIGGRYAVIGAHEAEVIADAIRKAISLQATDAVA